MQVIGCQFDIVWEDKRANYDRVQLLLSSIRPDPGALIVLPEMFATGFSMAVNRIAESDDGPSHRFLAELSKEYQSFVVGGVVTPADGHRGRNEAVVFNPEGKEIARYVKLYPYTLGGEGEHYEAGDRPVVTRCGPFQVAPLICYDLRFPELFRVAVRGGAQVFVVIANWPSVRTSHWQTLLKARAIENVAYIVGINRTGQDPRVQYSGHSLVIDPSGNFLAEGAEREQLVVSHLDEGHVDACRRNFPVLDDMRSDVLPG